MFYRGYFPVSIFHKAACLSAIWIGHNQILQTTRNTSELLNMKRWIKFLMEPSEFVEAWTIFVIVPSAFDVNQETVRRYLTNTIVQYFLTAKNVLLSKGKKIGSSVNKSPGAVNMSLIPRWVFHVKLQRLTSFTYVFFSFLYLCFAQRLCSLLCQIFPTPPTFPSLPPRLDTTLQKFSESPLHFTFPFWNRICCSPAICSYWVGQVLKKFLEFFLYHVRYQQPIRVEYLLEILRLNL